MTNSSSRKRTESEEARLPSRDRSQNLQTAVPISLPAEEIEALLRTARESSRLPTAANWDEELGPGDVQHLRGLSIAQLNSTLEATPPLNWPTTSLGPDALLRQAERHLAQALLDSGDPPRGTTSSDALPPYPSEAPERRLPPRGLTLEDFGDLELDISIELGRAELAIEELLKLREGSVVALDRLAGDPVDIVANGRLVARGELLVMDGKFGVRLSEVL